MRVKTFCAIENNVLLVKTTQEVEAQLKEEYSKKLELEYCTLSDPFKLETGWIEEDGIAYWPIIPVTCILNFLMINSVITDLSDYKALKGYIFLKLGGLAWKNIPCYRIRLLFSKSRQQTFRKHVRTPS